MPNMHYGLFACHDIQCIVLCFIDIYDCMVRACNHITTLVAMEQMEPAYCTSIRTTECYWNQSRYLLIHVHNMGEYVFSKVFVSNEKYPIEHRMLNLNKCILSTVKCWYIGWQLIPIIKKCVIFVLLLSDS